MPNTIGAHTYGNPHIFEWTNQYQLTIGKYCSIAEGVKILLDGNHRLDWVTTYPLHLLGVPEDPGHPVGDNITIGNVDALILPGITVGDGAVIGAGSVITHDVAIMRL